MAKSKKSLLILLIVLVLCIAAYCIYIIADKKAAGSAPDASTGVGAFTGEVTKLTVFNGEESNSYTFDIDNNKWSWDGDSELPVRSMYLNLVANTLEKLTAGRAFDMTDAPSAYGLDPASYSVLATDENGVALELLFGSKLDEGESYYAMEKGGSVIYTVGATVPENLAKPFWDMVSTDSMPGVDKNDMRLIRLAYGGSAVTFRQDASVEQQEQSVTDVETGEVTTSVTDVTVFDRYVSVGGRLTAMGDIGPGGDDSDELFTTLLRSVAELSISSGVDWKPDADKMAAYGLTSPYAELSVKYEKATTGTQGEYTLTVGAADESGTSRYVMLNDSSMVCLMKSSLIDTMLEDAGDITILM